MQAILVISTTTNYKQLEEFCSQFHNQPINVYIYNTSFTIMKKRDLERNNIIFVPKSAIVNNIELSLIKYAMSNTKNTHFHLVNDYSFIFPNCNIFNKFFNQTQSCFISLDNPYQWSITLEAAKYIIKTYTNEEHIIDLLTDIDFIDVVNSNLRFSKDVLSVINLKEYIDNNILNKLILHNIDCSKIGYEQILKQLKYIYARFNNGREQH